MKRFPESAETHEEALHYYRNRAIQQLARGWSWDGKHVRHDWGVEVALRDAMGVEHRSVYVLAPYAGQGRLTQWFKDNPGVRFVSSDMCERMKDYLDRHGIRYTNIPRRSLPAYQAIEEYYGDRRARRSGLYYMNHIDEGLDVLISRGASPAAIQAWCLHPLVQMDEDLLVNKDRLKDQDPEAVALAMEYRWVANNHLSKHPPKMPELSCLVSVNEMLVADKMQNRKDFELHLRGRPDVKNSDRLGTYFMEWFEALGITLDDYKAWVRSVQARTGCL